MLAHAKVDYVMKDHTFESWAEIKEQGKSGEMGGLPRVNFGTIKGAQ